MVKHFKISYINRKTMEVNLQINHTWPVIRQCTVYTKRSTVKLIGISGKALLSDECKHRLH